MIDKVILAGIHILGGTEVHTVLFAHILDLLVCTGQADDVGVELLQVLAQHLGGIAGGVTSDENGQEDILALGGGLDLVDDLGHLIQFIGTDIGAVSEAEVDLQT